MNQAPIIDDAFVEEFYKSDIAVRYMIQRFPTIEIDEAQHIVKSIMQGKVHIRISKKLSETNDNQIDNGEIHLYFLKEMRKELDDIAKEFIPDPVNKILVYFLSKDQTDKKIGRTLLADYIISKYHFKTIFGIKYNELLYYKDGIYQNMGHQIVQEQIEEILGEEAINNVVNEVISKIMRKTGIDRSDIDNQNTDLICCNNGILNWKTMEFINHSPNYIFRSKISVNYKPDAKCDVILKWLKETFNRDDVQDIEILINTVQEAIGYCLYKGHPVKKAIVLDGETDTSKTTFLNMLHEFLGEKNISGESLQRINKNNFSASNLYHKLANIRDELSARDINDVDTFKILTGDGYCSAEIKHGECFRFKSYAKQWYACNAIPSVKFEGEDAESYYNRWVILQFINRVREEDKDYELNKKLTSKEELEGLLIWAIEGLKRLMKQKQYTLKWSAKEIQMYMERSNSSIASFIQDCLVEGNNNDWLSKEEMFNEFEDYCKKNNQKPVTQQKFGAELPRYANYLVNGKKGNTKGWRFVKTKENSNNEIETELNVGDFNHL